MAFEAVANLNQQDRERRSCGQSDRPRVVVFTTLFPNPAQPRLGGFVRDRVVAVAKHLPTCVVAPVQSNFGRAIRGAAAADVPEVERLGEVEVYHPRFTTLPGVGRSADARLLFAQTRSFVARLHERFSFDLIDSHYAFPDGAAAVLLGRRFNVPVSITVRGGDLDMLTKFPMRRGIIRRTLHEADKVFSVSEHLVERARELGIEREIRVVHNGVDAGTFFASGQTEARRRLGLDGAGKLLLCVGNLTPEKGQHVLIEALGRLAAAGEKPPSLAIIGSDQWGGNTYGQRLEERIAQLGLKEVVHLLGSMTHAELAGWYNAADLLVLPTFREGCPNVVREALACGLPVVASRVGGVPELVKSEDLGFLVGAGDVEALADAVGRALCKHWSRTTIAEQGGCRTWQSVAATVASDLRSLAGTTR